MNVFADYHQTDLKYSLQLLFEKRLGGDIFFPIGLEWYTEGYWNVYPHMDTAKQYLDLRDIYVPKDGTLPLNEAWKDQEGLYLIEDKHNEDFHKAITFDYFKKTPIDIVIASIPQHIEPFKKLAAMKGAKFIFQAGNVFPEVEYSQIPNLMANTLPPNPPPHTIQYHQEFDLSIYKPSSEPPERLISSFINIYSANAGYEDFITMNAYLPDFQFKSYGAQNRDGVLNTTQEIANKIRESYFIFHSKRMGDGYGYGLYTAFACGKPIITRISDYKGKLGEELLEDDETCIDLDKHEYNEVQYIISTMSPDKYDYMCQQAYNRFEACVNYDEEEIKIRKFLEELQ